MTNAAQVTHVYRKYCHVHDIHNNKKVTAQREWW